MKIRPNAQHWFVTAPHGRIERIAGGGTRLTPVSRAHVKELGGRVSACGTPAVGEWPVFWEVALTSPGVDWCPDCGQVSGAVPAALAQYRRDQLNDERRNAATA